MRNFIIVGANNFWCSNLEVKGETNAEVKQELQAEVERLKEDLSSENVPDEFFIYETKSVTPFLKINNPNGNPAAV
ncbi:MAG: hypothetical protein BWY47_01544 [Bacteroidetes bacterium ADurb.Bin302]|jgi:hypothetical protein|nr:MAG: hypothetical protein BWY47_01544 [Bacteroidetes bacterium ADurb.Bin302]